MLRGHVSNVYEWRIDAGRQKKNSWNISKEANNGATAL